jgi:regulator of sigma E protease
MISLQYILAFLFLIVTVVTIHELGHYSVARLCGVKVLRFSVGMGKVIFSRRFGPDQTEWAISLLPLGGYVKMLDAREQDVSTLSEQDLKREFTHQTVWRRIAIVAAGPIANFLLAIAIFTWLFNHGIPEPSPRLRAVAENSVAWQAGLRGDELVTAVDGEPVHIWSDLRWKMIQAAVGKSSVKLDVQRPNPGPSGGNLLMTVTVPTSSISGADLEGDFLAKLGLELSRQKAQMDKIPPEGPAHEAGLREGDLILEINGKRVVDAMAFVETIRASAGKQLEMRGIHADRSEFVTNVVPQPQVRGGRTIGVINAPLALDMTTARYGPAEAFGRAVGKTWDTSILTLKMLGKMLTGEVSWKNITGPITIADYAGQTARIGLISFLSYIALISISLGVMNLLPIPVLDGGLLLYYSLEVLTGRPVSERMGEIAQRAGLGILMTLMAVAVFNDIIRLIS